MYAMTTFFGWQLRWHFIETSWTQPSQMERVQRQTDYKQRKIAQHIKTTRTEAFSTAAAIPHLQQSSLVIEKGYWPLCSIKLWFTTTCFVGFNSMPNLIVISFNLLNHVFIVRFNCKGCVIERESVKTQAIEDRRVLAGSSQLSIPRNDACALHMTGMRKVRTNGDSCVSRVARR